MNITSEKTDKVTGVLFLSGRLDTASAPQLEQKIRQWGPEIAVLVLDFTGLEYISSMGLRVLLQAKKESSRDGRKLIITNLSERVREIFEITGFLDLMAREEKLVVVRKDDQSSVALALVGQMQSENMQLIEEALTGIREPVTVYLDMEKLSYISAGAAELLGQAITRTDFHGRKVSARNVSVDMQAALTEYGLHYLL